MTSATPTIPPDTASAGPAEEHLEDRAGQKGDLRAILRGPDDVLLGWGSGR